MKALIIILLSITSVCAVEVEQANLTAKVKEEMPSWDKTTLSRVEKYAPILVELAISLDMSPELLLSIAWAESHFDPKAKSWAGARGIMQVKPSTQRWMFKKFYGNSCKRLVNKNLVLKKPRVEPVYEIDMKCKSYQDKVRGVYSLMLNKYKVHHSVLDNMLAGTLYIRYLKNKFDGDVQKTVIAYNEGPTKAQRLIKKKKDLDKHRYYVKIHNRLVAMK